MMSPFEFRVAERKLACASDVIRALTHEINQDRATPETVALIRAARAFRGELDSLLRAADAHQRESAEETRIG